MNIQSTAESRPTPMNWRCQVLINLNKWTERSEITPDSDKFITPSFESKYLAGAWHHPPEGSELTTSPSRTRIFIQLANLRRQSHFGISVNESRNNSWEQSSSRDRILTSHMEAVTVQLYLSEDKLRQLHMSRRKMYTPRKILICLVWWHFTISYRSN
jgi:hypothetical protein